MKKKILVSVILLSCIVLTAFTMNREKEKKKLLYKWWDYNSTTAWGQTDPANYSADPDNFPECPPTPAIIYCEIYALPSAWDPNQPNLGNIINYRFRPLH